MPSVHIVCKGEEKSSSETPTGHLGWTYHWVSSLADKGITASLRTGKGRDLFHILPKAVIPQYLHFLMVQMVREDFLPTNSQDRKHRTPCIATYPIRVQSHLPRVPFLHASLTRWQQGPSWDVKDWLCPACQRSQCIHSVLSKRF